jgi:hypothetical protein
MLAAGVALGSSCCAVSPRPPAWQTAITQQTQLLGYRNWIVIAEASFPAYSRPGVRQVNAAADIPEAVDFVLNALESTEHVRPTIYLTRELRSVENDFAPGIDEFRGRIRGSLHGHEPTELDQQALLVLLEDANRNFNVLVVRTPTALPYSSVFLELQPGYWDAESESRLRARIAAERLERERVDRERMDRVARPIP